MRELELAAQADLLAASVRLGCRDKAVVDLQNHVVDEESGMIVHRADIQRDLFEALGEAEIAFPDDEELGKLIEVVRLARVEIDREKISALTTTAQVDDLKRTMHDETNANVTNLIQTPIKAVLDELMKQIKNSR
jgi:hypothetical protein